MKRRFSMDPAAQRQKLPANFDEAREGFSEALERWQQNSGERETLIEALDEKRRVYEQYLIDLEFENARAALADGDHAARNHGI